MKRHSFSLVLSGIVGLVLFFGTSSVFAAGETLAATPTTTTPSASQGDTIMGTKFEINTTTFSPSANPIGAKDGNLANGIIEKIATMLLVVIPLFAVVSIIVGGIFMITAGDSSERASKGKTIIKLNIIALILALLSYSIVQLVLWILK